MTTPLHPSRPSGTECAALQADAGFVVSCIDQGRPMTLEQATALAAEHARTVGGRWAIYQVHSVAMPGQGEPVKVDAIVERARAAVRGVT